MQYSHWTACQFYDFRLDLGPGWTEMFCIQKRLPKEPFQWGQVSAFAFTGFDLLVDHPLLCD